MNGMERKGMESSTGDNTQVSTHEWMRRRPAMYIGRIGSSGLSHLLGDLILQAATELNAKEIKMELRKSGKIILTLHNASVNRNHLFAAIEGKPSTGALSLTVCVALSTSFVIVVKGKKYRVDNNGAVTPRLLKTANGIYREVQFTFSPDRMLFGDTGPEELMFYQLVSEVALTMPDVKIVVRSNYTQPFTQFVAHCPKGIRHFLDLAEGRAAGREFEQGLYFNEQGVSGQIGWFYARWCPSGTQVISFANGRITLKGGSHVDGVVEGITEAIIKRTKRKKEYSVDADKVVSNLCLAVSVWGDDFSYAGSTKDCLDHEHTKKVIKKTVAGKFEEWMQKSPEDAEKFLQRFSTVQRIPDFLQQILKNKK